MKLEEAFFDYKPAPSFLSKTVGKNYEIFVNPTSKEIAEFKDGYRFLACAKKKEMYIFSVYILHQLAANDIWDSKVDLYKAPHILSGTIVDKKIEDLVPFNENASEVFDKKYYQGLKKHDWSWLSKYFNTAELEKELEK
jgi:hypothetical protein